MKSSERKKFHREMYRKAFPSNFKKAKILTMEDFGGMLGGKGGRK